MKISSIGESIPPSPVRKLAALAKITERKGIKIHHLNIGDPDLPPHSVFLQAFDEFQGNLIPYADSKGENSLLEALIWYYLQLGIQKLGKENIQVTSGASEAILWAFSIAADPGEEIILFEPFYSNYKAFARQTGTHLVPVTTLIEKGFHLPSKEKIQEKISSRTSAICVCNPNNPTGTVLTKEEMEMIVEIAKQNDLWLLVDETYRELVYDGKKPLSFLQLNEYEDGVVVLESVSKTFSLCGLRVGALVSRNKKFIDTALKYSQTRLGAGYVDQQIAAKITQLPKKYFEERRREYQERRDLVYNLLHKNSMVSCQKPEGSFYILLEIPIEDSEDFSKWLLTDFYLNKETIMVTPATDFYGTKGMGRNKIRIAYVINNLDLTKSINILNKAITVYISQK